MAAKPAKKKGSPFGLPKPGLVPAKPVKQVKPVTGSPVATPYGAVTPGPGTSKPPVKGGKPTAVPPPGKTPVKPGPPVPTRGKPGAAPAKPGFKPPVKKKPTSFPRKGK